MVGICSWKFGKSYHVFSLEVRQVVFLLIEQMLDFLLVDFDLRLVPLLRLFQLPILDSGLGTAFVQLSNQEEDIFKSFV